MRSRRWLEPAITAFGKRLGLSDGQAYTVLTGMVVAVGLLAVGLPPVLGHRGIAPVELTAPASSAEGGAAASTEPDVSLPLVPVPTPNSFNFASPPPLLDQDVATASPIPSIIGEVLALGTTKRFAAVPDPGAPAGIAVGPDGTVYVAMGNALTKGGAGPGVVAAFDPTGKLVRTWPIEGMAATRTVGLTDVVVDASGAVWILDGSSARILRLDPGAAAPTMVATVPDVPSCAFGLRPPPCEPGLSDGVPELRGLALRPAGGVYVADRVQGLIWSVDRTGAVAQVVGVEDRLAGEGPVDLVVMGDGSLVVVISARLGSMPPGLPAVVRFRAQGSGFEAPAVVTDLAVGDAPQSIVVTDTGRVFLALSGVNEVVDMGLEQGDQVRYGPGLDPAFDVPIGLALREGSLLVTNQGPVNADASHWYVLALGVLDRPPSLTTRSTS